MGRFYEDIRLLGGTVSIGSLTTIDPNNIMEITGNSAIIGTLSTINITTTNLKVSNGAQNGYILQSDASGNATWVTATAASANFANTDLTLTSNRQHTIPSGNTLLIAENYFTTGPFLFMGGSGSGDDYTFLGHDSNYYEVDGNALRLNFNSQVRVEVDATETVINEVGGNYDFRIEGDTQPNLFFVDASTDNIGVGNNTPAYRLQVTGTVSTTGFRMTNGASNGYILQSDASGNATWVLPTDNAGVTGSGTTNYIPRWTATDTLSSTGSVYDDGTNVGIGTTSPTQAKLEVRNISALADTRGIRVLVDNATQRNTGYISQHGSIYGLSSMDMGYHSYIGTGYSSNQTSVTSFRADNLGQTSTNYGYYSAVSGANSANYGYYSGVTGTYSITKYGFYSSVDGSNGSSTVNYGGYFGSNNGFRNVGMYALAGSGNVGISGDVAIAARVSSVLTSSQSNTYVAYLLNGDDRSGAQAHGVWIQNSAVASTKYGYYASVVGNGTSTTNYGQSITVSGANGNNTGSAIFVTGTYSGVKTGIDLTVNGASPGTNYGMQIRVNGATTDNYALRVYEGDVVFNEDGGDYDFRIEGDTEQNLFFVDASTDNIGMGNNTPNYRLEVTGTVSTTGFRMTNGASSGYILESDASGNATWVAPSAGGGGVTGSGTTNYFPKWNGVDSLTSTSLIYSTDTGVGFGTTSTNEMLDIEGNAKITGQVYVDIPTTLTPSTNAQTINWNDGNIQIVDFGSAPTGVTFSFSNPKTGGVYTIEIIQGPNLTTVNWPSAMKWEGGTPLTPTTTDNAIDVVTMVYNGTNYLSSYGTDFA